MFLCSYVQKSTTKLAIRPSVIKDTPPQSADIPCQQTKRARQAARWPSSSSRITLHKDNQKKSKTRKKYAAYCANGCFHIPLYKPTSEKMMKRNELLQRRINGLSPEAKASVDISFSIIDKICDALDSKGWKQKDLADKMGKTEAEISRWMRGTHDFTADEITAIRNAFLIGQHPE